MPTGIFSVSFVLVEKQKDVVVDAHTTVDEITRQAKIEMMTMLVA